MDETLLVILPNTRTTIRDVMEKRLLELPPLDMGEFILTESFYSLQEGRLLEPLLITKLCPVCKNEFTVYSWQERIYCSSECGHFDRRKGTKRAKEIGEKISKARTGKPGGKRSPVFKEKMRLIMKELWKDPDFQKMMKDARDSRPNCFEVEFGTFFPELTYTGDFSFFVGRKNPDFFFKGTNRCIDLFGDHWHELSEVQKRIEYFSQRGYELLVIWQSEWKEDKDGDIIQRVNEFLGS